MDERVAMAISHWSPRFTTNGVTAGDFEPPGRRIEIPFGGAHMVGVLREPAPDRDRAVAGWVAERPGAPARRPAPAAA